MVNEDLHREAIGHITERDRAIVRLVARHRVFTTDQLTRLFFTNLTTARHRLTVLWRLRLLDRFRPLARNASATGLHAGGYCYVLDELGGWQVHLEAGGDPERFRWRRRRQGDDIADASSQQLTHRLEVNEFFTRLLVRARHDPSVELNPWLSEAQCADHIPRTLGLRPDGYGLWHQDGRQVGFHLEWDRGTEPLSMLRDKLSRYSDMQNAHLLNGNQATWVLVCVPSARRARHVRQTLSELSECQAPVATAVLAPDTAPDAPIWRPVNHPQLAPVRLVDLARLPLPAALVRSVREALDHERWRQQRGYWAPLRPPEQLTAVTAYLDQHDPNIRDEYFAPPER